MIDFLRLYCMIALPVGCVIYVIYWTTLKITSIVAGWIDSYFDRQLREDAS